MRIDINGRSYDLPIVTIDAGQIMYRGLNMPCDRVYQSDPNVTIFVSPQLEMAKGYGTCVETYKAIRPIVLLDLWTPPVVDMLQEQLRGDAQYAFRYFSGQDGTTPRMKSKQVYNNDGSISVISEPNPIAPDVHAVLPDSELINNGTAIRWRGLVWGDTDGHFSRNSNPDSDSVVFTAIRELLRDQVDGLYAVRTPSRQHEDPTLDYRPFFHEETLIFRPGSNLDFVNRDETGQQRREAVDYSRALMMLGRRGGKRRHTKKRGGRRRKMTSKYKK